MSNKNKSQDAANKAKPAVSVWKKAFIANTEWPDKVSLPISLFLSQA